jgi:hypothetical protein
MLLQRRCDLADNVQIMHRCALPGNSSDTLHDT